MLNYLCNWFDYENTERTLVERGCKNQPWMIVDYSEKFIG